MVFVECVEIAGERRGVRHRVLRRAGARMGGRHASGVRRPRPLARGCDRRPDHGLCRRGISGWRGARPSRGRWRADGRLHANVPGVRGNERAFVLRGVRGSECSPSGMQRGCGANEARGRRRSTEAWPRTLDGHMGRASPEHDGDHLRGGDAARRLGRHCDTQKAACSRVKSRRCPRYRLC